jgi:hypothetical protein
MMMSDLISDPRSMSGVCEADGSLCAVLKEWHPVGI